MNDRWPDSLSNIVPCCRNINLPVRLSKLNSHTSLRCSEKQFIKQLHSRHEPMISVEEQRLTRKMNLPSIQCKSNHTDKCYAEYNINSFRKGFGLLKDIRYEKIEPGKPSLMIHSGNFQKSQIDSFTATNHALKELAEIELRKRFALVYSETCIYIIGGYIFDPEIPIRKKPLNDYKYDFQTRKLISTQALPNGAMGGSDIYNRPLSDCYFLTINHANETWAKLPNLPAPTSGPGLGAYNGVLHCIGGFDILASQSIAHGEYLMLDYRQDKQWQYGPELSVIRVRPIVFIDTNSSINNHNVYVAGGFNINPNSYKPYIVPDLQLFNRAIQSWQYVTTIPDLELTHELSFEHNKLHVSEIIEVADKIPETNTLYTFDLEKLIWTDTKNNIANNRIQEIKHQQNTEHYHSPLNIIILYNNMQNIWIFIYLITVTSIPIIESFVPISNDQRENNSDDLDQILSVPDYSSSRSDSLSAVEKENAPECLSKISLSEAFNRNRRASISRPYFYHWRAARENNRPTSKNVLPFSSRLGKRAYEDKQKQDIVINKQQTERDNEFNDVLPFLLGYLTGKNIDITYEDSTKICLTQSIDNGMIQEILGKFYNSQCQPNKELTQERQLTGKGSVWFCSRLD
ncbi:unnamed protein product [Rotaria socialis]|uniref:Uncharacterized protein n=2 Tax=Rotaria socialis TaxID=392032 RepID=A0A819W981_9BILA|nr:unnamed protein product [Rotaria socialis]